MGIPDFFGQLLGTVPPGAPSRPERNVGSLAQMLGVPLAVLGSCRPTYHTFTIPKHSGGSRTIQEPDPDTKALQRLLLRRVLSRSTLHRCSTAFRRGRGIVENALPHVGKGVVLHMDMKNFFPSTRESRVRAAFRTQGWDEDTAALLTGLCCLEGGLPQGAPTSPMLSNIVNYRLDCRLAGMARSNSPGCGGVSYTRYADDITFSFGADVRGSVVTDFINMTRRVLHANGYRLHPAKTRVMRRHQRQVVTGLVVNESINLPRPLRRKLRAIQHRFMTGGDVTLTPEQMAGWIGMLRLVENGKNALRHDRALA